VKDVRQHQNTYLAQIDEDKAKYFDRITTELQMLPFLLAGFPPDGYIEWIAESLSNLTLDINTTQGNCHTNFLCGVRQGSALSCTIANMVAWLCTSIWDTPSPPPNNPTSGFIPTALDSTDALHKTPQSLPKAPTATMPTRSSLVTTLNTSSHSCATTSPSLDTSPSLPK